MMRAGLRISNLSCEAVILDGNTVACSARVSTRGSIAETVEHLFFELGLDYANEVTDVTVDVGRVLASAQLDDVVAIRISPRPPADKYHSMGLPEMVRPVVVRTAHIRGGHDIHGHELSPLDIDSLTAQLPSLLEGPVRNIAVSAFGSTATNDHEARVADAILSRHSEKRVTISHDFYSNIFRDRDFTSILNSALLDTGQRVSETLEGLCRRHFPAARLAFAKNDGGRAPLNRLSTTPVHGLYPEPGMRLVGASLLAAAPDGEIIIGDDQGTTIGRVRTGIPVSSSMIRLGFEASIASNTAELTRHTTSHTRPTGTTTVVADLRSNSDTPLPNGLVSTMFPSEDLGLIGCAAAAWTAWVERLETVASATDLSVAQHRAEEDAMSAAIVFGADAALASIVESNVFALPYGDPDIVRVRVQAAGDSPLTSQVHAPVGTREAMP